MHINFELFLRAQSSNDKTRQRKNMWGKILLVFEMIIYLLWEPSPFSIYFQHYTLLSISLKFRFVQSSYSLWKCGRDSMCYVQALLITKILYSKAKKPKEKKHLSVIFTIVYVIKDIL